MFEKDQHHPVESAGELLLCGTRQVLQEAASDCGVWRKEKHVRKLSEKFDKQVSDSVMYYLQAVFETLHSVCAGQFEGSPMAVVRFAFL